MFTLESRRSNQMQVKWKKNNGKPREVNSKQNIWVFYGRIHIDLNQHLVRMLWMLRENEREKKGARAVGGRECVDQRQDCPVRRNIE